LDIVPAGACSVVDVGAGDGQLALALAERGLRVVATERAAGPFERLERGAAGLDCRLGDGLGPLLPGEVEGAVLAGMGGATITAILDRAGDGARSLDWLVLQPQQGAHELERWLMAHGYQILEATWAVQGRRLYRVLLVGSK
jgi:tRNA (adenine22-N1)-methyltransferase